MVNHIIGLLLCYQSIDMLNGIKSGFAHAPLFLRNFLCNINHILVLCLMESILSFLMSFFIDKVKKQFISAKNFLDLKSPREKKLVFSYSGLYVLVAIIVGAISSGNGGESVGGSRSLFIANSVYTYPNFSASHVNNQTYCSEINQQSEYNKLLSDGWRITSTQPEERSISQPYSASFATGKCIGTLYILNK